MKIYTKTGDDGSTSLYGSQRVHKSHAVIECIGSIDELNSFIGLLACQEACVCYQGFLQQIQQHLFVIGGELASIFKDQKRLKNISLQDDMIANLEEAIDRFEEVLPAMTHFVLPGGHQSVSLCHVCRSICRKSERFIQSFHQKVPLNTTILKYLNRLSDYFFVLARKLTMDLNIKEVKWIP